MKKRTPYKVALGERANTVLVAIVSRHHVKPEQLLRVMCETELAFAVNDEPLESMYVDHAGVLDRGGDPALEQLYWEQKHPRYDGARVDLSEGQPPAPDDVPEYRPPATWHHHNERTGKHHVTLQLSNFAYAGLVMLKEYDEKDSVEEWIMENLGSEFQCLAEARDFPTWFGGFAGNE